MTENIYKQSIVSNFQAITELAEVVISGVFVITKLLSAIPCSTPQQHDTHKKEALYVTITHESPCNQSIQELFWCHEGIKGEQKGLCELRV